MNELINKTYNDEYNDLIKPRLNNKVYKVPSISFVRFISEYLNNSIIKDYYERIENNTNLNLRIELGKLI